MPLIEEITPDETIFVDNPTRVTIEVLEELSQQQTQQTTVKEEIVDKENGHTELDDKKGNIFINRGYPFFVDDKSLYFEWGQNMNI